MQQTERGNETSQKPTCEDSSSLIPIMKASWDKLFFHTVLLLICCRGANTKTPGSSAPPVDPISPLPTDVRTVVLKGEIHTERVELVRPVNLTLECTWTGNANNPTNITGFWRKDGLEIENSRLTVQLENEQYNLKREFNIVSKENLGNYSCLFGSDAKIYFVLEAPQIGEVRDRPVVSYVGDTVVIACKMEETKPKPTSWNWYKANGTEKEQILEDQRYQIKNKEEKTQLLVHNLTEDDSGSYYCGAVYPISTTLGHVELRVITFHEPLKPFIVIVVEVTVLVAAILLYEKSRSKNTSSEGNETMDQTNTLTHEENDGSEGSSSIRQRKV